jgi:hypothetical protein
LCLLQAHHNQNKQAIMSLSKPNKHLQYDEEHFEGFWVRLMALIRHNDDADELIDGYLELPLRKLADLEDEDDMTQTLFALYQEKGISYPPTEEQIKADPLGVIRDFYKVVKNTENEAIIAWKEENNEALKRYRKAAKHIYEVTVSTVTVAQATELVGSLEYGAGPELLVRMQERQRRQTSMSLFTLFESVISIKLKTGEKLSTLFSRLTNLRRRLANWTPPIRLPDQLIVVCILRALPSSYNATRTIIMATQGISLETVRAMLLDAENADARLIKNTLGSGAQQHSTGAQQTSTKTGHGLATTTDRQRKPRRIPKKTDKYHEEGPCPNHPDSGHAPSECWKTHPELNPFNKKKVGTNKTAPATAAAPAPEPAQTSLYGFMTNEALSTSGIPGNHNELYAFMRAHDSDEPPELSSASDDDSSSDEEDDSSNEDDDSDTDVEVTVSSPLMEVASLSLSGAVRLAGNKVVSEDPSGSAPATLSEFLARQEPSQSMISGISQSANPDPLKCLTDKTDSKTEQGRYEELTADNWDWESDYEEVCKQQCGNAAFITWALTKSTRISAKSHATSDRNFQRNIVMFTLPRYQSPCDLFRLSWPDYIEGTNANEHGWCLVAGANDPDDGGPIIDSGACSHICNARAALNNLGTSYLTGISDVSGNVSPVEGMGSTPHLRDVMLVPASKHQLLSVGSLLDQTLDGSITFTPRHVFLSTPSKPNEQIGSRCKDGLYRVTQARFNFVEGPSTGTALLGKNQIAFQLLRERVHRLHRVFGHASKEKLRLVLKHNPKFNIHADNVKLLTDCHACSLARTKRARAPKVAQTRATAFGERIAADCSGRLRTRSLAGKTYACVCVDQFSGWVWFSPLASLAQVSAVLKDLLEVSLHQRTDNVVKYFRSDGGTEFCNAVVTALLRQYNIERETTCAGTSYQNGQAERHIGLLFSTMRTHLVDARLPASFWAEAMACATYVHNRTPGPSGKTPFELRYARKPVTAHLRPFGCPCSALANLGSRERPDKSAATALPATMMGYGYVTGQKGYRVLLHAAKKVVTTANVTFTDFDSGVLQRANHLPELYTSTADLASTLLDLTLDADASAERGSNSDERPSDNTNAEHNKIFDVSSGDATAIRPTNNERLNKNDTADEADPAGTPIVTQSVPEMGKYDLDNEPPTAESTSDKEPPAAGKGYYYTKEDGTRNAAFDTDSDTEVDTTVPKQTRSGKTFPSVPIAPMFASKQHASDCTPNYLGLVAAATQDLAKNHITPKHYGEAMRSRDWKHWRRAMDEELAALRKLHCYDLIDQSDVPAGKNVIGYTWVYKIKINEDGSVSRFKARICVDGSKQKYGIDYQDTFAPVANAATIRIVLAIAMHQRLHLRQFDIKLAFVSADLDTPIYMKSPVGAREPGGSVWALRRSLYGLKQSPRLFNAKLHSVLVALSWTQSAHDPCLYYVRTADTFSLLAVVVDDLLLATSDLSFVEAFNVEMRKQFDFKSMGFPTYMIGMHLQRKDGELRISQRQYIRDVANRFAPVVGELKPTLLPAPPTLQLVKTGIAGVPPSPPVDPKVYRALVGSLMYAVVTRPDVAAPVSMCARFLAAPTAAHLAQATRILRYLLATLDLALTYHCSANPALVTYVDASWAADPDLRRSRYGYAIYYGRALVCWRSKLHACICLSSAEAEYIGATEACKDTMWLRHLLKDLGLEQNSPTIIHEDNAACLKMATNKIVSGRNKHMEIKMHYVRERVEAKDIVLRYISTTHQRADLLTKNLPRPAYERIRELLMQPPPF